MKLQEIKKAGQKSHVNIMLFFEAEAAAAGSTPGTRAWKEAAKHCLLALCASASLVLLHPSPLQAVLEDVSKTPSSCQSFLCKNHNTQPMGAHKHFHLLSSILAQLESWLSYSL